MRSCGHGGVSLHFKIDYCKGRSYRATFPPNFRPFFQEKQEKPEKQETFPKLGNLAEGKIFGRLRIPIFGNNFWKTWKYENMKI